MGVPDIYRATVDEKNQDLSTTCVAEKLGTFESALNRFMFFAKKSDY